MPDLYIPELLIAQWLADKKNGISHTWDADELRCLNKAFQRVINSKLKFYEKVTVVVDVYQ